jgi:hypothetical protein
MSRCEGLANNTGDAAFQIIMLINIIVIIITIFIIIIIIIIFIIIIIIITIIIVLSKQSLCHYYLSNYHAMPTLFRSVFSSSSSLPLYRESHASKQPRPGPLFRAQRSSYAWCDHPRIIKVKIITKIVIIRKIIIMIIVIIMIIIIIITMIIIILINIKSYFCLAVIAVAIVVI